MAPAQNGDHSPPIASSGAAAAKSVVGRAIEDDREIEPDSATPRTVDTSPFLRSQWLRRPSTRMALTRRQKQVYDFLAGFVEAHGYSPSFEEIGEGLGLSSLATVHKHISNLEQKGLLKRDYTRSRSIDLLPPKGRLKIG